MTMRPRVRRHEARRLGDPLGGARLGAALVDGLDVRAERHLLGGRPPARVGPVAVAELAAVLFVFGVWV